MVVTIQRNSAHPWDTNIRQDLFLAFAHFWRQNMSCHSADKLRHFVEPAKETGDKTWEGKES